MTGRERQVASPLSGPCVCVIGGVGVGRCSVVSSFVVSWFRRWGSVAGAISGHKGSGDLGARLAS